MPYDSEAEKWSNLYAYQIGLGGSYGHVLKTAKIFCHDRYIVRDGVWGGTSGEIYCRCKMGDDYDDEISKGMKYRSCLQIKRVKKSATMTQKQKKDSMVTIQATNLITHADALFTTPTLSQITPNCISMGMRKNGQQKVIVIRGMT